jgi:hypothetical protein
MKGSKQTFEASSCHDLKYKASRAISLDLPEYSRLSLTQRAACVTRQGRVDNGQI